jgi:hypothetical protein
MGHNFGVDIPRVFHMHSWRERTRISHVISSYLLDFVKIHQVVEFINGTLEGYRHGSEVRRNMSNERHGFFNQQLIGIYLDMHIQA